MWHRWVVSQPLPGAAPAPQSCPLPHPAQLCTSGGGLRVKPSFQGRERGLRLGLGRGRDPKSAVQLQAQKQHGNWEEVAEAGTREWGWQLPPNALRTVCGSTAFISITYSILLGENRGKGISVSTF